MAQLLLHLIKKSFPLGQVSDKLRYTKYGLWPFKNILMIMPVYYPYSVNLRIVTADRLSFKLIEVNEN